MSTGALRWSLHSFSSSVGTRGPSYRQADRPAIVILLGVPYQMLLKKGLGLEALSTDLGERNESSRRAAEARTTECKLFSYSWMGGTESSSLPGDLSHSMPHREAEVSQQ